MLTVARLRSPRKLAPWFAGFREGLDRLGKAQPAKGQMLVVERHLGRVVKERAARLRDEGQATRMGKIFALDQDGIEDLLPKLLADLRPCLAAVVPQLLDGQHALRARRRAPAGG